MRTRDLITSVPAIVAVALTLGACNRSTVFNEYKPTPLAGWEKNDTLVFELKPVEEEMEVRQTVGLRINDAYPFKALCLIVDQMVFPEKTIMSDTINCQLFDNDGKNQGHGVSLYQYTFPVGARRLKNGDSLVIRIRHNMKREIVPGVSDVGVSLQRVRF